MDIDNKSKDEILERVKRMVCKTEYAPVTSFRHKCFLKLFFL